MSRARIRRGGTPGQPTAPAGASGRRTLTVRRCSPSITRSAAAADWAGWRSRTPSRTTSGPARRGGPRSPAQRASGLEWHTLGGHFRDTEPFWSAVGAEVDGGYTQAEHLPAPDRWLAHTRQPQMYP